MFPVERTYSEWAASVYAQDAIETGGRFGGDKTAVSSCQDCHMPDALGTGCNPNFDPPVRPDVPRHSFAGANSWVLRAIRSQYDDADTGLTQQSVDDAVARNEAMLAAAASVEAVIDSGDLRVRITNMMGHKLPTGYGEGRRMWLDVRFFDVDGNLVEQRGGYDQITADLDEQTTEVFEILHGIDAQMSAATGLPPGRACTSSSTTPPTRTTASPRGASRDAVYNAIGAKVIGAVYEDEQYWSETRFSLPGGASRAEVRLFHQTTSKEYVEFLRDENVTDAKGD